MPKSLQGRISLLIVFVSGLMLLAFSALSIKNAVDREMEVAQERQGSSIATAAKALDAAYDSVSVRFAADGRPQRIEWGAAPDLSDHALIDKIGSITGETATVFVFEQSNGDFWRRSTNIIKDDGQRAVGTPLGVGGTVHQAIMRGETYIGEATILGRQYYTIYVPVYNRAGEIDGILYVGVSQDSINAAMYGAALELGMLSIVLLFLAAVTSYWLAGRSFRDLNAVTDTLARLSDGETISEVPGLTRDDAIGDLARTVEKFRADRDKLAALDAQREAAEARASQERQAMLEALSNSFGVVAKAAARGDFTARVDTNFAEETLSQLAEEYNSVLSSVETGLKETIDALNKLSEGDLRTRMSGEFHGAFSHLQQSVNGTIEHLSELIASIASSTETVSDGAAEITLGAESLASRAEQQASSLEETAATMEQMSASIKSNADSSLSAQSQASDASSRASSGQTVVGDAVKAMNEIEAGASKITDIIGVIDGIAFQTNLLALNAAVEAARAGDAGKGFAVVASEVRALAQRSSDAARDIRGLIETSSAQVADGVRLVSEAGDSLQGIVAAIQQVEESIRSIADASREQATGVEEITTTISHMDEITQQNSSVAEESASRARAMSEGASELRRLTAVFKTPAGREIKADAEWHKAAATSPSAPAPAARPPAPAPRAASADGDSWQDF